MGERETGHLFMRAASAGDARRSTTGLRESRGAATAARPQPNSRAAGVFRRAASAETDSPFGWIDTEFSRASSRGSSSSKTPKPPVVPVFQRAASAASDKERGKAKPVRGEGDVGEASRAKHRSDSPFGWIDAEFSRASSRGSSSSKTPKPPVVSVFQRAASAASDKERGKAQHVEEKGNNGEVGEAGGPGERTVPLANVKKKGADPFAYLKAESSKKQPFACLDTEGGMCVIVCV